MSIHINAKMGDIAETVLLPGDPLRAKWIAENFLEDPILYNDVRGMLGYTGTYKGKPISVQGTGMGTPSMGIYSHELINNFGVKNLIRVGSAGSYQKEIKIRDIVIAMSASSNTSLNQLSFNGESYAPTASYDLFSKAVNAANNLNIPFKAGNILSSDVFYQEDPNYYKKWAKYGVLCVEMETSTLYSVASRHRVNALSLLTISDSLVTKETTSFQERETTFIEMIKIALELA